MSKALNFFLSVFFVVGLVAPSSFVFAQTPGETCAQSGGAWDGTTCNHPSTSPSPSYSYTPPATTSPSPSPSYSSSPSPSASYSPPPTTSPSPSPSYSSSPSPSTSSSQCTSAAPGYCSSPSACQGAGNYWCGGSTGTGPCVQSSAMTSCPASGASPYPSYSPGSSPSSYACAYGQHWDSVQNRCVEVNQQCAPGQYFDGQKCTSTAGQSPSPTYSTGQSPSPYPSTQQCKTGEYFDFGKNSCVAFAQQQQCQPPQYFDYRENRCVEPLKCAADEHPESGSDGKIACVKGGSFGGKQSCNAPPGCAVFPDQYGGCRYDCSNARPTGCQKTDADLAREKADFEKSCQGGSIKRVKVDQFCDGYICDYSSGGYFSQGQGQFDYSKFQQGPSTQGGQPGYFGGQQGPGFFQQGPSFCEPAEQLKQKKDSAEASGSVECFIENRGGCSSLQCFPKATAQQYKNVDFSGSDANEKCIQSGGDIFEKRNDKGELEAFDCVHSPKQSLKKRKVISPTEKVPSTLEIASVLLQVEELKPPILELKSRTEGLVNFYKDQKDESNTVRFEKASDKFATAASNVDIVRDEIKALVETPTATGGLTGQQIAKEAKAKKKLTTHTMDQIRSKIKEKIEGPLEDAVFILVGSEKEVEKVVSNTAEDVTVSDEEEFKSEMEWRIQNCKPGKVSADFTPEGAPAGISVKMTGDIKGLAANGNCDATVSGSFPSFENGKISTGKEQSMSCSLPEDVYAAANIDEAGDEILKHCSGALVDTLKEGGSGSGPGGQGPAELMKLSEELGGSGSPEDLKELCSESKDNANKCLTVLQDFNSKNPGMVPEEALTGLKYLAEGKQPEFAGGFPGSQGLPQGGPQFPSGQQFPPECQAAGATTPQACEAIMKQKYGGSNGPPQGGQQQGFNQQPPQQNFNQPQQGFNQPYNGGQQPQSFQSPTGGDFRQPQFNQPPQNFNQPPSGGA